MEIGKEEPAITIEPVEDPFETRPAPEPSPTPAPVPEKEREKVPA